MKKSLIFFAAVVFSSLLLFGYKYVEKIFASDPSSCLTQQQNCNNGCYSKDGDAFLNCINNCKSQSMACLGNNAQPQVQQPQTQQQQVQQPQEEQPQKFQEQLPIAVPQESLPTPAEKGKPFWHDYSGELTALLGPDSSGCPCSFNLDTMGGFPPMGLILGPDGVLRGTPTGKDSKFRACVKDVGGNTACKVINIDVQKEGESEFVVPGNFYLTELAYNNLPYGKQYQSSQYERAVINMPDGSEMHMDMGSTITPVSDYEVKSDIGRFMYDYKPASGGGGCGPIGQSPTWACRQVDARDSTLRVKGTQFAVDTDTYGTNIIVMEGVLSVSDPNGNKTVEVAEGQYTYIAKWGLPTDPQSFDTSQVDFWWKEKTAEQIKNEKIISYTAIFLVGVFSILLIKRKQIWPKRFGKPAFPVRTVASVMKEKNPKIMEIIIANCYQLLAVLAFLIGFAAVAVPINNILGINNIVGFFPLPIPILNFVTSTAFFAVKMAGLVFGIVAFRSTKISFALFIVMLNIVGIVLGLLFGF